MVDRREGISLSTIVRYLSEKERLVVNPRYRYDMRSVIMSLNNEGIDSIKQQFIISDGHVQLQKFLWLLRHAIDNAADEHLLYYQLTRLFEEIDIDGSNTIEWGEFLQYLSESAWAAMATEEAGGKGQVYDKRVLFHAFAQSVKYRKQPIKKLVEVQRNGMLGVVTRDSHVQFIDYQQREAQREGREEVLRFSLQSVDHTRVLSLDYAEEERLFGVLMANRNLCFIEEGEMQKNLGVIRSSGAEVDIRYLPSHRLWALESTNSTLHLFASPKTAAIQTQLLFRPHIQPLTALRQIVSPFTLCTSSLDGTVRLWQAGGQLVIELSASKEGGVGSEQRKGVKGMATYSRGCVSYICTWMFTSQLFLWLPSLSLSKPFAGELRGHVGLVLDCVFTQRGEVVSLDDRRGLRVWNPQKFQCVQALTLEQEGQGLFVLRGRPYLLVYSKLMDFFRVRTNSRADLQREIGLSGLGQRNVLSLGDGSAHLVGTGFSTYYSSMVVVTNRQAKILQVNSGTVLATMRPGSEEEEFVGVSMQNMRRVYVGSSRGVVYQYKMEDGALVKVLPVCGGDSQLRFVFYHEGTKILLVVVERGQLSELITFDELEQEESRVKQIEFTQVDLLGFQFDTVRERFFIVSQDCVTVWDYEKLVVVGRVRTREAIEGMWVGALLERDSGNLLLLGEEASGVIRWLGQEGAVECVKLQLQREKEGVASSLAAGALLKQKVPSGYLQMAKARRTRRMMPMQTKQKKKVGFEVVQDLNDIAMSSQQLQITAIVLALSDHFGETLYYNVTQYFTPSNGKRPPLKNNLQRLKERRGVHMKPITRLRFVEEVDLSFDLFSEQVTFLPKAVKAGSAAGHFFLHTSDNSIHFYSIYGASKGEWALGLGPPRVWNVAYNELEEVLARLDRTYRALARMCQLEEDRFKIQFLVAKYMTQDEVMELQRFEERKKMSSKVSLGRSVGGSKRSMKSVKSMSQLQDDSSTPKLAVIDQMNQHRQRQEGNLFLRKLQHRDHRKQLKKNSAFYDKIQKSLKAQRPVTSIPRSSTVKIIPQIQEKGELLVYLQGYFGSATEAGVEQTEAKSVKSVKKEGRRQSVGGRSGVSGKQESVGEVGRRLLSVKEGESRIKKVSDWVKEGRRQARDGQVVKAGGGLGNGRMRASFSELSKNFVQGKLQYKNYMQQSGLIIQAATGSLAKKGKIRLQL